MKKFQALVLLLLVANFSLAQLKLYPIVGTAFSNCKMVENTPEFKTVKNKRSGNYIGLGIEKALNEKVNIHVQFVNTVTWLTAGNTKNPKVIGLNFYEKILTENRGLIRGIGIGVNNYNLLFNYKWFDFSLKKQNNDKRIDFNYLVGVSVNQVNRMNYQPNESTDSTGNTFSTGANNFDYVGTGNNKIFGDKVVKNYWGASIQLGYALQFTKGDKDRLAIRFMYNQGLTKLLYSPFTTRAFKNDELVSKSTSAFASYGSHWSIALSYPITILNKKGERHRDRHPK